jgi:phosphoribosylformylglycinamidine synthase
MVLAVPEANLPALAAICAEEHVELADLGRFGTPGAELVLRFRGEEVGRLSMHLLHEGIPMPTREAVWVGGRDGETERRRDEGASGGAQGPSIEEALLALLAHPNIASKHWIIRQYDHEVQGATVVKPLVGPKGRGPSDAAVVEPVPGTGRGLAIGCGLATGLEADPYTMALAAIDECVRNLVCVGADPDRIAILDNFCWPGCESPEKLAALVRAAEGCYDGAKAYRTPFVSGKDSLNNQFTTADGRTIAIPPTLLISGIGVVGDIARCVTSDAKRAGRRLVLVSGCATPHALRGSHYDRLFGLQGLATDGGISADVAPAVDLSAGPAAARFVASLIAQGRVHSAHDVSDGGLLVAAAEMLIGAAGNGRTLGALINVRGAGPDAAALFGEAPHAYLLEMDEMSDAEGDTMEAAARARGLVCQAIGTITGDGVLSVQTLRSGVVNWPVEALAKAWLSPLDW